MTVSQALGHPIITVNTMDQDRVSLYPEQGKSTQSVTMSQDRVRLYTL